MPTIETLAKALQQAVKQLDDGNFYCEGRTIELYDVSYYDFARIILEKLNEKT